MLAMSDKFNVKGSVIAAVCVFIMTVAVFSVARPKDEVSERKFSVTATFYPLYVSLLNITDGADVDVKLLAPSNTGCLHDYQLSAGDMKKIETASVLVANGLGMEDFLEKAIESKKERVIISGEGFEVFDENPHVWVSVEGCIHQVRKISEGLCRFDPDNAEIYLKNTDTYVKKLEDLKKYMHDELDEFSGCRIVTFHEAFPYFAKEFGLVEEAVIEREPGTVPGAQELSELIALVNGILSEEKKIALFAEPQYSSSTAEIIARETGLTVYELDPCVTENKDTDVMESYISTMKKNASVLKSALSSAKE